MCIRDRYEALLRQDEKEAHHVATALEIYVTGSLNLFNHRTNVDINNRLVCYDIKEDLLLSVVGHDPYAHASRRTHAGYFPASCPSPHRISCHSA